MKLASAVRPLRKSIRDSVNDVQFTLLLAGVLVVLVIYLFLGNLVGHADPGGGACRSR